MTVPPSAALRRALLLVLVAGFLLTFSYALFFQIEPVVDARGYDRIGANIAAGYGYQLDTAVPPAEDLAISFMGPGYEFFLGFLYRVFGHHLAVVWFFQSLLHTATAFLLFLIASRAFGRVGERAGFAAAVLYLFCIDLIQMPAMTMTETLYLFALALATYAFVRFFESPTYILAGTLGIAGALAVMVRPTTVLFLVVLVLCAFLRRHYGKAVVILVCAALVVAPWTIRNYLVYDRFILTTAAGGYGLWLGNNPGAEGGAHPTEEIVAYANTHSFLETSAEGARQAKHFIITEPFHAATIMVWKATAYFSVARPYAFWFYFDGHPLAQKVVLALSVLWSFLLFTFGIAGAWLVWRSREPLGRWLIVLAATMPLAVIPIIVETRYRLPFYLPLALFGGYLLAHAYDLYREDKHAVLRLWPVALGASLFIVLVTSFDALRNLALVVSRLGL